MEFRTKFCAGNRGGAVLTIPLHIACGTIPSPERSAPQGASGGGKPVQPTSSPLADLMASALIRRDACSRSSDASPFAPVAFILNATPPFDDTNCSTDPCRLPRPLGRERARAVSHEV